MTGRKKILLVTAGFPFGQWERGFLTTEFEHLRQNFDVTVMSVGREDPMQYPAPEGVRVERFLFPKLPSLPVLASKLLIPQVLKEVLRAVRGAAVKTALSRTKMVCAYYWRAQQAAKMMETLVREEKIDLIYTYWCNEPAVAACLMKKKYPRLRFITRFHGHDLFRERKLSAWQPFKPLVCQWADRLVFACRMGKEYFENIWGGGEKTQLSYLGCSDAPVVEHQPSEVLRLVSCSNLIPLKRVDCIIDAISLLPKTMKLSWDHFGDGSQMEDLCSRAAEKLGDHVAWKLHGAIPNLTLRQTYRQLDPDLFLTASSTEGGAPVSIQEVFGLGIPAVGTAVGGIPELIEDGRTGFLLPEDATPRQLADAILNFAALTAEEKMAMSAAARACWQTHFDAQRNAKAFIHDLWQLLLEESQESL